MAGICCGVVGEGEASAAMEPSSLQSLKRRKMEILTAYKLIADVAVPPPAPVPECSPKRRRLEEPRRKVTEGASSLVNGATRAAREISSAPSAEPVRVENPRFGLTSVCGRRRDMEDAVSVHPSFSQDEADRLHFFGVFDGHGCSHVAMKCKDRLHEIVKEEISPASESAEWKEAMERSFQRMDAEVQERNGAGDFKSSSCRCELQTPQCDAVGSTAVVAVLTPEKIVVSNCGDSRAVLSRNGLAVPLSSDHKPDRPDELVRIEAAGGRVIYWDGARVLGMLAMSRAIGDNYLKPYVIAEPEVTVTERTDGDECLILASDGLWDVVSNDTACGVARMCLRASPESSDKACSDASILLTKLALARHSSDNVSVVVVDLRRTQRPHHHHHHQQ